MVGLVLRKNAGSIAVTMDSNGWIDTNILIRQMKSEGFDLSLDILKSIVETNGKQRYEFNDNFSKVRSVQRQVARVETADTPEKPPKTLYYSTTPLSVERILKKGLSAKKDNLVNLSLQKPVVEDGVSVKGPKVTLIINAAGMHNDGISFFKGDNDSWLTRDILPKYIDLAG